MCAKLPLFKLDTLLESHRPRTLTRTPDTYDPKALRDVSSLVTLGACSRTGGASGSLRKRTWNPSASPKTSVLVGKALAIVDFPHGPRSRHGPDVIPLDIHRLNHFCLFTHLRVRTRLVDEQVYNFSLSRASILLRAP